MTLRNYLILICFLFLIFSLFNSCKREKKTGLTIKNREVKHLLKELKKPKTIDISIKRYDKALFEINKNYVKNELKKLYNDSYKFFLGENYEDEHNISQLLSYLNDPLIQTLQKDAKTKYPTLKFLETQLSSVFQRIKILFPEFTIPTVYTYISGGDYESPIRYVGDTVLLIALDMYLGPYYPIYDMWGLPKFISSKMQKEYIIIDCVKEIGRGILNKYNNSNTTTLLDKMIYNGKILYFVDLCLPDVHDSLKIHYTTHQLGWAETYQDKVWSFFIEKNLLYSKDTRTNNNFLANVPFTATFSRNSAPRLGHFIGWQIIRSFMKNNPNTTIKQLFSIQNSSQILHQAKYKP